MSRGGLLTGGGGEEQRISFSSAADLLYQSGPGHKPHPFNMPLFCQKTNVLLSVISLPKYSAINYALFVTLISFFHVEAAGLPA